MDCHAIDDNVVESFAGIPDGNKNFSRVVASGYVMGAMNVEIGEPEVSVRSVRFSACNIEAVLIAADHFKIVDLPSLLANQLHCCGVHAAVNDRLGSGSIGINNDGGGSGSRAKRGHDAAAGHSALE
jgi:hypothetical protein